MAELIGQEFWVKGFDRIVKKGWFSSLTSMAYDYQTNCLAVAGSRGHIIMVDLGTLECIEPHRIDAGVRCLCFADSGHLVVGLDNGSIATVSAQGTHLLTASISRRAITTLAWSHHFGLIAAAEDQMFRRINPATLSEVATSEKQRWICTHLDLLEAENQLIAAGSDNKLHLLDLELLAPLLVIHDGHARQTHAKAGHGHFVTAGQNGAVTILDSETHSQICVLPITDGSISGVQIPSEHPSLFLADQSGTVQEWDLSGLEPTSALQVEGITKALAVSPSGDVVAVCTDKSVQVYLRASQLNQLARYEQELAQRNSFIGRLELFFRRLFRRTIPALPQAPQLPRALAVAALKTDPEVRNIERSTSEALVKAYRGVADAARRVDWKGISSEFEKHHRRHHESQQLELRRLREERLSQALKEAQEQRKFREYQLQLRQEAIRRAEAEQRSKKFWDGVGRLMGTFASSASSSRDKGTKGIPNIRKDVTRDRTRGGDTWVNSYTRKDGKQVRGYRRR